MTEIPYAVIADNIYINVARINNVVANSNLRIFLTPRDAIIDFGSTWLHTLYGCDVLNVHIPDIERS